MSRLDMLPDSKEQKVLTWYLEILKCFEEAIDHIFLSNEPFNCTKIITKQYIITRYIFQKWKLLFFKFKYFFLYCLV